ncbi:MAG TPA: ATP-binding protein [Burkholderiales bacterium]|nr:ATP-binding protein [Burkholderiales bacterium]
MTWVSGKRATRECPCGYLGHYTNRCRCTPGEIQRYRSRISGPLLDRIDVQIDVPAVAPEDLAAAPGGERSSAIRCRVVRARERQLERQEKSNARLTPAEVELHCTADARGAELLNQALRRLGLSARGYHRILKVARTIADLTDDRSIAAAHIAEAIQYRRLDRT